MSNRFKICCSIIVASLIMIACNTTEKQPINSKEEIAWSKLQLSKKDIDFSEFIQSYPKSKYISLAAKSYLSLKDSLEYDNIYCCCRYNADIQIADATRILFNNELVAKDSLPNMVFNYLNSNYLLRDIKIPRSNNYGKISSGKIALVIMPANSENIYIPKALIQVHKALEQYKHQLAFQWYAKPFEKLTDSTKYYLNKEMANKISFVYYRPSSPPPPPAISAN